MFSILMRIVGFLSCVGFGQHCVEPAQGVAEGSQGRYSAGLEEVKPANQSTNQRLPFDLGKCS